MKPFSKEDFFKIREASKIVSDTIKLLARLLNPNITTLDLDQQAKEFIEARNARPAFKGYKGFPANICVSINEEIVHGIPSQRPIKESDLVSLDVGVEFEGFFSDAAATFIVGNASKDCQRLVRVTREALYLGIDQIRPDKRLFDISAAIQKHVEENNFSVVRQFVGHGIGQKLHEEPQIPNFGQRGTGPLLKKGMLLAIEPMVNMGTWEVEILENGWTAVTKDRKPSAHFEHTVLVTEDGYDILTE